ncbi:MAG TPA: hypothetical protein PK323_15220 [Bacteroidia bacterium]|nr:hypothetical protein [Bacteroidia bacterium]
MKKEIFICIIAFILFFNGKNCNPIFWDERQVLTFLDFKRINKDAKFTEAIVAQSHVLVTNFVEIEDDYIIIKVRAEFCRDSSSFIYKGFYTDSTTLIHEQTHFNICELWARELRKLYTTKYKTEQEFLENYDNDYKRILDSVDVYHDLIDQNYWYENKSERNLWILNKINNLSAYSNPIVKLNYKSK